MKNPPSLKTLTKALLINDLLDAAFAQLQHDTGPNNVEWHWQRKVLREKFTDILKASHKGKRLK